MTVKHLAFTIAAVSALVCGIEGAAAQDAISAPAQKTIGAPSKAASQMVPSLAVLNSGGATLSGHTLTMSDISSCLPTDLSDPRGMC